MMDRRGDVLHIHLMSEDGFSIDNQSTFICCLPILPCMSFEVVGSVIVLTNYLSRYLFGWDMELIRVGRV